MLPHGVNVNIIYVRDNFSLEVVYDARCSVLECTRAALRLHQHCTRASFLLRSQNPLQRGNAFVSSKVEEKLDPMHGSQWWQLCESHDFVCRVLVPRKPLSVCAALF